MIRRSTSAKSKLHKKDNGRYFWDCRGILLINLKESNSQVNAEYYVSLLINLWCIIKEKRWGKLSRGCWDSSRQSLVHPALISKVAIKDFGYQEISYPPYSPDLAPCRQSFHKVKNLTFMGGDEQAYIFFFFRGIEMLPKCCIKCEEHTKKKQQ